MRECGREYDMHPLIRTLTSVHKHTHTRSCAHTHALTHIHIYSRLRSLVYICMYMHVHIFILVGTRLKEKLIDNMICVRRTPIYVYTHSHTCIQGGEEA